MALVNPLGELRFNGVNWGPYSSLESFTCRPELSTDGRTVKWTKYTVTIRTILSGRTSAEVDALAITCRQALTKSGGPLRITHRAIGTVVLNEGSGGVRDVHNGPIPELLSFTPAVGGDLTSSLLFTLSWCLVECPDASYQFRPVEFYWTPTWTQDLAGYTTLSIRGSVVIPQNRVTPSTRWSSDSADNYRESVVPNEIVGFRRIIGPITLSPGRSKLDFSCDFVELGLHIPPPGCAEADASYELRTSTPGAVKWEVVMTGNYTVSKHGVISDAINGFLIFMAGRCNHILALGAVAKQDVALIPRAFSLREPSVYGPQKVSMACTWSFVTTLDNILRTGAGAFTQVPGNTWARWSRSLETSALNVRGSAKLVLRAGPLDRITDLCDKGPVAKPTTIQEIGNKQQPKALVAKFQDIFPFPTVGASWIDYQNYITLETLDSGVLAIRTLPTEPVTSKTDITGTWDAAGGLKAAAQATLQNYINNPGGGIANNGGGVGNGGQFQLPPNAPPGRLENTQHPSGTATATRSRRPQFGVWLKGRAMRVAYDIPEPVLESINGVRLLPMGGKFECKPIGNCPNGATIYAAEWKLFFLPETDLPDLPLPPLPNPLYPNR